jgi:uncharacterized metal-binding protein
MSDTLTHDLVCAGTGLFLVTGYVVTKQHYLLPASLGAFSGLLMSPDWDWDGWLVNGNDKTYIVSGRKTSQFEMRKKRVYGKVIRRWPYLIQKWLQVYALVFNHRKGNKHGLSHTFLLGTLIRCIWLIFPLIVAYFFPIIMLSWFVGLLVVDSLHIFMDFNL